MRLRSIKNISGFSLIEILAGVSVVSLVSMTSVFLIGQTKQTESSGEAIFQLHQSHILALQKSKDIAGLKAAIGLTSGSMLSNCFSGRGTGCSSFSVPAWTTLPTLTSTSNEAGGHTVATTGQYRILCTQPTYCDALIVRIQSNMMHGSVLVAARNSEVRLGGVFLGDRQKIDFSCAGSGKILTALDMQTLTGECLPLPASGSCAGPLPITRYRIGLAPDCQPLSTISCANGLKKIGILSGQGECI